MPSMTSLLSSAFMHSWYFMICQSDCRYMFREFKIKALLSFTISQNSHCIQFIFLSARFLYFFLSVRFLYFNCLQIFCVCPALDLYDGSCENLSQWLRETESQFKDCELKSTLKEKEHQVQTFKVRVVQI